MFHEFLLTPNRYGPESGVVEKVMKLSFQPYKVLLKRTLCVAVALFLVQTVSGIREGNEVQVVDESDFNVYVSDAAMSSSSEMPFVSRSPYPTKLLDEVTSLHLNN